MKKILLLSAIMILISTSNAQQVALTKTNGMESFEERRSTKVIPVLSNNEYTYTYNNNEVSVHFKDDEHIEYFDNKKYYIKSKTQWVTSDECYMILQESNLPNFPFKKGTKLYMKILKEKNGKLYYETTIGGKTWSGKMKAKE